MIGCYIELLSCAEKKKLQQLKKKKIKIKVVLDNFSDRSVRMVNTYWKVVQNI